MVLIRGLIEIIYVNTQQHSTLPATTTTLPLIAETVRCRTQGEGEGKS